MMAQCISPIRLKRADGFQDVPCGRCGFCLQNRRKEWSFRLQKELRQHTSAFFLTLTYNDLSVPWMDHPDHEFPIEVLQKDDFQKFMKRLRKKHSTMFPGVRLKYYAVGEYGGTTSRPHYHAIVFSLRKEFLPQIASIWSVRNVPLGFVHIGSVTNDSIDYVTKYVINRYEQKHYLVPPFSLISNGIGLNHFDQNKTLYSHEDTVINDRGYKQVLPRYYRNKIEKPAAKFDEFEFESNGKAKQAKKKQEALEREREELKRLEKLHPDSLSYFHERKVAGNDRILRTSKDGQKL